MGFLGQIETTFYSTGSLPDWFWPVIGLSFLLSLVFIAATWRIFTKAGHPGWACLIPFYNTYVMIKVAGRPGWWFWLLLIPFVGIVVLFIVFIDLAKAFGKGTGFGLGLIFLSFLFFPILAWGSATYQLAKPGEALVQPASTSLPPTTPTVPPPV